MKGDCNYEKRISLVRFIQYIKMVARTGFEPVTLGASVLRSTIGAIVPYIN